MGTAIALNPVGHTDDGAFLTVTDFARDTHWLNTVMVGYSAGGIGLFGLLILAVWWHARSIDTAKMTAVLAVPTSAVTAYLANYAVKLLVAEQRPCYAFARAFILEACPPRNDY